MSDEVITLDLLINQAQSATSVAELKKVIKDMTAEAIKAQQAGNTMLSDKFFKAAAHAKDELGDIQEKIKALNPDEKAKQFAQFGSTIAGSFQAATGAMALFGVEGEDVQKTLLKVQAATALAQGIQSVSELGKQFKILDTIMKANPFLSIVAAIGLLVAAFVSLKDKIFGASAEVTKLNKELEKEKKITEQLNKTLDIQLTAIEGLNGKENETYELKRKKIVQLQKELILSAQIALQKYKEAEAESTLQETIFRGLGQSEAADILKKARLIESQKQVVDAYNNLKEINAQLENLDKKELERKVEINKRIVQDGKKKNEELHKQQEDEYQFRLDQERKYQEQIKQIQDEYLRQQSDLRKLANINQETADADARKIRQENEKKDGAERLANEKMLAEAKKQITASTFSALASLGQIFINNAQKLEKFNKGLALTQLAVDTAKAISGAVAQAQSVPFPANIAAIATGVAAVLANIAKAKQLLSAAGATGGVNLQGAGSIGGGAGNFSQGVPINPVTTNSTVLDQNGNPVNQNQNNQVPLKAYVVETEISSSQRHINSIENKAKF